MFDPTGDYVYITHCAFVETSSAISIIVMKLHASNGTRIWSRTYTTDGLSGAEWLVPVVSFNKLTNSIYVGVSINTKAHLIRLDTNGGTLKNVKVTTGSYSYGSIDII